MRSRAVSLPALVLALDRRRRCPACSACSRSSRELLEPLLDRVRHRCDGARRRRRRAAPRPRPAPGARIRRAAMAPRLPARARRPRRSGGADVDAVRQSADVGARRLPTSTRRRAPTWISTLRRRSACSAHRRWCTMLEHAGVVAPAVERGRRRAHVARGVDLAGRPRPAARSSSEDLGAARPATSDRSALHGRATLRSTDDVDRRRPTTPGRSKRSSTRWPCRTASSRHPVRRREPAGDRRRRVTTVVDATERWLQDAPASWSDIRLDRTPMAARRPLFRDARSENVDAATSQLELGSLLDELDQGAERRLRVHERDRRAPAPGPGRLVDHPVALGLHPLERRGAVVDPVADVVEALALASRGTSRPASRRGSA